MKMTLSIKGLLSSYEDFSSIRIHITKNKTKQNRAQHYGSVIPELRRWRQKDLWACLASLAKLENLSFNEKLCPESRKKNEERT